MSQVADKCWDHVTATAANRQTSLSEHTIKTSLLEMRCEKNIEPILHNLLNMICKKSTCPLKEILGSLLHDILVSTNK